MEALGEASSHEITSKRLTLLGERSGACDAVEKSVNSGAADYRLDGAWGSLPGKISSPHFFYPVDLEESCNPVLTNYALLTSDLDLFGL